MKNTDNATLIQLIAILNESLHDGKEQTRRIIFSFLQTPELPIQFIDYLDALPEELPEQEEAEYAACIYGLELGLTELQMSVENGNRQAGKIINQIMNHLSAAMLQKKHSVGYWMPILNVLYDVRIPLSPALQDAYLELADLEAEEAPMDEAALRQNIQAMIHEMSDLSDFDIAENFFAQSHAMPPEFIGQLILDLYDIEEGREIALLGLLHPDPEFREVAVEALDMVFETHTISSLSLTRLLAIKSWYPDAYQDMFARWIKMQRKRGVTFSPDHAVAQIMSIKASEIDGTGSQGFYIHFKIKRQSFLGGVLVKEGIGIKDVWMSPPVTKKDTQTFYASSNEGDGITLREVDQNTFEMIVNHFLAVMLAAHAMPDLHLFELQENLGLHFKPVLIQTEALIRQLCVQIAPFTESMIEQSLKRSKAWTHSRRFTESWFLESAEIDKIVNNYCTFMNGAKVCNMPEAMHAIFEQIFEQQRTYWMFHFLKMSLWAGSIAHQKEKLGMDNLLIAYAILEGMPLCEIPIMIEICRQTVINSVETMNERKTYLS